MTSVRLLRTDSKFITGQEGLSTARQHSGKVQQQPRTAASSDDRLHTQLAGTTAKRPAAPLVRDEEAVRNHDETATLVRASVDGSAAGGRRDPGEAADSL